MKRIVAIVCIILGIGLVIGSSALLIRNQNEEIQAKQVTEEYLPLIIDVIESRAKENSDNISSESDNSIAGNSIPEDVHNQSNSLVSNMLVAEIDGYDFVGYITIPKLGLQLPVMSQTDMDLMKIAPCRFSGSPKTNDLVVGAHNYEIHFGNIDNLSEGDSVTFTDMEGNVWQYEVAFTEILLPTEAEALKNSDYPLTIYTCTYDGESRITVRCKNR